MSDNHAAMCVYCGEAVIYDTREVTDMADAHAKIVEHDQHCPRNPLVARIAELEKTVAQQKAALHIAQNAGIEHLFRCKELEKALEPFAREHYDLSSFSPSEEKCIGRQDLRRAAALLKEKE